MANFCDDLARVQRLEARLQTVDDMDTATLDRLHRLAIGLSEYYIENPHARAAVTDYVNSAIRIRDGMPFTSTANSVAAHQ